MTLVTHFIPSSFLLALGIFTPLRPVCCVRNGCAFLLPPCAGARCRPAGTPGSAAACRCRSGRRGPCVAAPRAAPASCWRRDSAGTPCAAGARLQALRDVHLLAVARDLAQRILAACGTSPWRSPSGEGRKACTWSARKPFFFSHSASSSMSSSVVPGCAAMKYGIRYCSLPASFEYLSNSSLNL